MNLALNDADIKVLDLLADDYYGLWEVCDYFAQVAASGDSVAARDTCRSRIRMYFDEGLIDVFFGSMSKNDFKRVDNSVAPDLLAKEDSWRKPTGSGEVVAVSLTKKAEDALAHAANSNPSP